MWARALAKLSNKHLLSFAGNVLASLSGFVGFGLLARVLPKEDFGIWILFITILNLVEMVRSGWVHTAMLRFSSGLDKKAFLEITGAVWFISLGVTALVILFNLLSNFLPGINSPSLSFTLHWLSIISLITLPLNISTWILQAQQRFSMVIVLRLASQGLFIIMLVIAMLQGNCSVNTIAILYGASNLFAGIMAILLGWSGLAGMFQTSRKAISKLFHFSKYNIGTLLGSNLLRSSDTLLIGWLMGTPAVALYAVPQKIVELIEIPLRSTLATAMPQMAAAYNKGELAVLVQVLKKYCGTLTLLLLIPAIGGMLLSPQIIVVLGGASYESAWFLLCIFLLYAVLLPLDRFSGVSLDIINQPRLNFIKVSIMLLINIVGDIVLIHLFNSVTAVIIGSIFTFASGIVVGHYLLQRFVSYSLVDILQEGWIQCRAIVYKLLSVLRLQPKA